MSRGGSAKVFGLINRAEIGWTVLDPGKETLIAALCG